MSKLASIKARYDESFADLSEYLENPDADLSVAAEKEAVHNAIKAELLEAEELSKRFQASADEVKARSDAKPVNRFATGHVRTEGTKSLGQQIIESSAFKSWSGSFDVDYKTTLASTGLTGFDRPPGIVNLGVQQPVVADLIPQGTTDQPTVRLFVENSFTNYAGMTSENGAKPEAAIDLTEKDFPVRKIAVLQPVTDEMLNDHPAVMSYLNERLPYGVKLVEETQILNGNGTGSNLTGIMATSGIGTYAKGTESGESNANAISKAIAKVQALGFYQADGMVVHPLDWNILQREKDANGQYFGGGPFTGPYGVGQVNTLPRYWGLNVVITNSITQGTILVGAFRAGAQIFRRQGVTIDMSDSHGTTFQYNVKTIRVEERLALAVIRPKSFATVTAIAQ
jgi:HK97 family phage major capsid protein